MELIRLSLYAPERIQDLQQQMVRAKAELKEAESNPTLIELNMKLQTKEKERDAKEKERKSLDQEIARLQVQIENKEKDLTERKAEYETLRLEVEKQADQEGQAYREAEDKYRHNRKTKNARVIRENFAPQKAQFMNEKDRLLNDQKAAYMHCR